MFKKKEESCRILDMISRDGRKYSIEQAGHLNTTRHDTVLQLLERRVERLRNGNKEVLFNERHNWLVDETGTIDTSPMELREAVQQEKLDMTGVSDEILKVHGVMPGRKPDGVLRLMYENVNSLPNRLGGNRKLDKMKDLIHEWGADMVGMVEHRQNLKHKQNGNGWNKLFRRGDEEVRSVVAHNVHENVSPIQEGGVGLVAFGPLIENLEMTQSGNDASGLGRWTMMTLQGDNIRTRIICGYNPCKSSAAGGAIRTSYAQHRRYLITTRGDTTTCPRTLFREELIKQLKAWRQEGDRIIICMDVNDHIYKGRIGRELTDIHGLGMKEVIQDYTGEKLGPTYFRGSIPIDGIWATTDIQISNACVMPAGYGIGDHRLFVVDLVMTSLIGDTTIHIKRPAARRLNTRLPYVAERYAAIYEEKVIRHRLIERLAEAHKEEIGDEEATQMIKRIDEESGHYMQHAEKKCRKFKSGRILFSPESVVWIKRKQIYLSLLDYRRGKVKKTGNLKRQALRQQISRPLSLSIREIKVKLEVCEQQLAHFREHGHRYRKQHLIQRATVARRAGKQEVAQQIIQIIEREKQKTFWGGLRRACGRKKGGSPTSVQVEGPMDTIVEYNTQEGMHNAIWDNIHHKRFYLAEDAPICKGQLREAFGYNGTSPTAQAVLEGTYQFPEEFDTATRELCEECARIRLNVPKNSIRTSINKDEWRGHWRKAKEDTSSSFSGRHFGHYKGGRSSEYISHFQAVLSSLIFHRGIVLERWAVGLSVMLEKIFGCRLVTKLRSILLMEADFNAANKIIFGNRLLANVRRYDLMPGEIYSEQGRTADEGTLAKVLVFDIARQFKVSTGVASVDADNCFDRIAHAMASMVFQALGTPPAAAEAMLTTIQEMKFFLRTGFGDSKSFANSTIEIKTQGMCQGNGAACAAWAVVNITIIRAHKRKGHGAKFLCPISNLNCHIAGVIFVDDTDLIHINMYANEDADETLFQLQESITNWGKLLLATGGALKPCKCFFYLISFEWREDGSWRYAENEKNEDYKIRVPLADGSMAEIEQHGVNAPSKTLGSVTCPTGSGEGAIMAMQEKSLTWAATVREGKMSRRNVWFMMGVQFWPRIAYGLCNNTSSVDTLAECLMKPYREIQRLGGYRSSARRDLRQLDIGFYGIGCPHPAIECAIAQIGKLLMHTGCKSDLGIKMQTSLEAFIIELGLSVQPFTEDYSSCSKWVTHSWVKTIWEKAHHFRLTIDINCVHLKPPRGEHDFWLMKELRKICTMDELVRLNRVRLHQQVLFGSDIMDAGGRALDKKYLTERPWGEKWSTYNFPNERPPPRDFQLWCERLPQLRHHSRLQMGNYVNPGHKVWDWTYDFEKGKLYHWIRNGVADIYGPSTSEGLATRANAWGRRLCEQQLDRTGNLCTVVQISDQYSVSVRSYSPTPPPAAVPSSFWEVLEKWESTWLWENVRMVGDDTWIAKAIVNNSLLAVTDGSYKGKEFAHMNSCAFIMECTQGRGKLVGTFPEQSRAAGAYRGELLGLLAIHLILLAVNTVAPEISGSVSVYSDCLNAVNRIGTLPTNRIPARYKQSDILKIIMIYCRALRFKIKYLHVEAHQDDDNDYANLSRPAQLNCACDLAAKMILQEVNPHNPPRQQLLPLEPVSVWVQEEKITPDSAERLRFWAHKRLARKTFAAAGILNHFQFDLVDWEAVHAALHSVPRMFQVFASKQVFDIGGTNRWLARFDQARQQSNKCPSCFEAVETAEHIVHCCHAGRVEALQLTIKLTDKWMKAVDTDPTIRDCIYFYLMERGTTEMTEVCDRLGCEAKYRRMAKGQDVIGWRRFLEGMVCNEFGRLQHDYYLACGSRKTGRKWAQLLIVKLLEITHGQWLYRNIQVHDKRSGLLATNRKEEIQAEIETQQEIGFNGLLEEDAYLGECNLGDLEDTSGEEEQYWLLAVKAARKAKAIELSKTGQASTGIT